MIALSDYKRELGDNGIEQYGMRIEVYDTQRDEFIAVSWKTGIKVRGNNTLLFRATTTL